MQNLILYFIKPFSICQGLFIAAVIQGRLNKYMIVARAPVHAIDDFEEWRFFAGYSWTPDLSTAKRLFGEAANEYSVSFLPALERYIMEFPGISWPGWRFCPGAPGAILSPCTNAPRLTGIPTYSAMLPRPTRPFPKGPGN